MTYNYSDGSILQNNDYTYLSNLENELFNKLFTTQDRFVKRSELFAVLWDGFPSDDALDVLVLRLRRRIKPLGIRVIGRRGFGYRMDIR